MPLSQLSSLWYHSIYILDQRSLLYHWLGISIWICHMYHLLNIPQTKRIPFPLSSGSHDFTFSVVLYLSGWNHQALSFLSLNQGLNLHRIFFFFLLSYMQLPDPDFPDSTWISALFYISVAALGTVLSLPGHERVSAGLLQSSPNWSLYFHSWPCFQATVYTAARVDF